MKQVLDPIIKTTSDLSDTVKRVTQDGLQFLRSNLGSIPLFASVRAVESAELKDRDETHYFLVPYRLSECGYSLFNQRVLPEGIGPENDLPKVRVFHLPAEGTLETLESLVIDQLKDETIQSLDVTNSVADRLDKIAEEIDNQSNKITGGLVIIGGVVAVVNPLLGVGIAAKALLPVIGNKLSKHGINHFSEWLRDKKLQSSEKLATTKAEQEVKRLQPEIYIDPTLQLLELSLSTSDPDHDPNLLFAHAMATPAEASSAALTAIAIGGTYEECLKDSALFEQALLHPADITWLKMLKDLQKTKIS